MKLFKQCTIFLLILLASLSMMACSKAEGNSSKKENSSSEVFTDKKTEKVTIKIISTESRESYDKDARTKIFFDSIDEFNENSEVAVIEYENIPHDSYQQKIQVLAAANELPDLFSVKGSWNKNFVANDLVANLTPYLDADPEWSNIIKPITNMNFEVDDNFYALSAVAGGATSMVFYNQDILNECGVDSFPETKEAFFDAIEKIKAKGYTPIAMGNKGKWLAESCYLSTIGNRFTGVDWTTSIIDGTGAKFTDQEFIDALAYFQDLANTGAFNTDLNSIDYNQQKTLYYNKDAAMMVEGFWAISALTSDAPEDVLAATKIANLPVGVGDPNMTTGGANGWAFAINSQLDDVKKEAALEWLKLYISEESASILYNNGFIPGMKTESYDKDNLDRLQLDYYAFMDEVVPCEVYDLTFDPAVEAVLESSLQELLINMITPEKMAERIQAEYEKVTR